MGPFSIIPPPLLACRGLHPAYLKFQPTSHKFRPLFYFCPADLFLLLTNASVYLLALKQGYLKQTCTFVEKQVTRTKFICSPKFEHTWRPAKRLTSGHMHTYCNQTSLNMHAEFHFFMRAGHPLRPSVPFRLDAGKQRLFTLRHEDDPPPSAAVL